MVADLLRHEPVLRPGVTEVTVQAYRNLSQATSRPSIFDSNRTELLQPQYAMRTE
ncbi:hypothetical protein BgiMline_026248, partial [Biomphalaria glabrata]